MRADGFFGHGINGPPRQIHRPVWKNRFLSFVAQMPADDELLTSKRPMARESENTQTDGNLRSSKPFP
jgi:hypothetical protein